MTRCSLFLIAVVSHLRQTVKIMDHIDLTNISMREKFEAEVERMRKFQRAFTDGAARTSSKSTRGWSYATTLNICYARVAS